MNFSGADYLRYAWHLVSGTRARHERMIDGWRRRDLEQYVNGSRRFDVLDLANGRLRPQCQLMTTAGHTVYGVDLANLPTRAGIDIAYAPARWLYQRSLGMSAGVVPSHHLVAGTADALPFADASFDLVSSVAAFEHFIDVPNVVSEIHRVLRDGGLAWVCIHLFSSLSGGHNIGYVDVPATRLPRGMEPWDHLRERRHPFTVPLNRWRRDQYLDEFASKLQVFKHYCALKEGESLLTPALEATLAGYDREELLSATYIIVATKTARGPVERRL